MPATASFHFGHRQPAIHLGRGCAGSGRRLTRYHQSARVGVASNPTLAFSNPFPGVTLGGPSTYPFANAVNANLKGIHNQQY